MCLYLFIYLFIFYVSKSHYEPVILILPRRILIYWWLHCWFILYCWQIWAVYCWKYSAVPINCWLEELISITSHHFHQLIQFRGKYSRLVFSSLSVNLLDMNASWSAELTWCVTCKVDVGYVDCSSIIVQPLHCFCCF